MVRSSRVNSGRISGRVLALLALLVLAGCCGACASRGVVATSACDPCVVAAPDLGDRPPEAQAGEAWCKIWIPERTEVISETVCVKPASKRTIRIPPVYGTRPKLVCDTPASLDEKVTPAVWGTTTCERVICPEQEGWRRVDCPPNELGPCEVQKECWAKVVRPAVTREEEQAVCLEPERRCVQYRPAQYRMVEERYILEPARCEEVCDPPVFENRCSTRVVEPGHWEWRRNADCEVPQACPPVMPAPAPLPPPKPVGLPALQVEMQDSAESGVEAGTFAVGDVVRYDLHVINDEGSVSLDGLTVTFTLPGELEFISGGGEGVVITGAGQAAESAGFGLAVGERREMHVLCRVLGVPPTNLVQLSASVRGSDGFELAVETESSTLKPAR